MSIKDMPYTTVEQVLRLREVAIQAEGKRDALAAHVERLRDRLTCMTEYWNGAPESAVDAIEHVEHEAHMALAETPETSLARLKAEALAALHLEDCATLQDVLERKHEAINELRRQAEGE